MTRFAWNALRVGDVVVVHDRLADDPSRGEGGRVAFVEVHTRRGGENRVGVRTGEGSNAHVTWPSRFEVRTA